jgi:hypothetical protein
MSKTVTLADVMNALEGMGVTGDPRTIAEVTISPDWSVRTDIGRIRVTRYHQRDGKNWLDDDRIVTTREDIRIVEKADPPTNRCAHCGDVIQLIDDEWKHGPGCRSPHEATPANLTNA